MEDELISVSDADLTLWCKLPVCGCGDPPALLAGYHAVLRVHPRTSGSHGHGIYDPCDECDDWPYGAQRVQRASDLYDPDGDGEIDPFLYDVIANVLDHMGATEHGGSIAGAWRTPEGERLLAMFELLEPTGYEGQIVGPFSELDLHQFGELPEETD